MRRGVVYCITFVFVMMIGLASADFTVVENSSYIDQKYLGGEIIQGGINISFDNEINGMISSNFEGGIELLKLLKKMEFNNSRDYSCNPVNCEDSYSSLDSGSKTRSINFGEFYGFRVTGTNVEIKDLNFDITSDVGSSCKNQLTADFLVDTKKEYSNRKNNGEVCAAIEPDYGCFDSEAEFQEVTLSTINNKYCEKVNLTAASGYEVGSKVSGSGSGNIELWLFNEEGDYLDSCEVRYKAEGITCQLNHSENTALEGFVCINAEKESDNYKIRRENKGKICGGVGKPGITFDFTHDFELYALPLKYAPIETIDFEKEYNKQTGDHIHEEADNYIYETYGRNCKPECLIPFQLFGQFGQNVTVDNIFVQWQDERARLDNDVIYRLFESPVSITSDYLTLDVGLMEFVAPNENGFETFKLQLNDKDVYEEEVEIEVGFDFSIGPRFALVGMATKFIATSNQGNITGSKWNFGDGSKEIISDDNSAVHTYRNDSSFNIKVTMYNAFNMSSTKTFRVIVGDAKTSANLTIQDYEARLKNIELKLKEYDNYVEGEIKEIFDLVTLKGAVGRIKSEYNLLGSNAKEKEYIAIINKLLVLDIPMTLEVSRSGSLSAAVGFSKLEVDLIASITKRDVNNEASVRNSIISWMNENYALEIEYETIDVIKEFEQEGLLTSYKIKMNRRTRADNLDSYLLIDYPEKDIKFKSNKYDVGEISDLSATYVKIKASEPEKSVEFLIVGENTPAIEDLGVYISPKLDQFTVIDVEPPDVKAFKWGRFLMGIFIVFVGVLSSYIFLQAWYKHNYEIHLFKNPNDLYNIINFIYNSRRVGLRDGDIREKLREKKWKGEQIAYAFKKIDGKRTGMWEIPLFKFMENRKVMKELQKKHPGEQLEERFIKRPNL